MNKHIFLFSVFALLVFPLIVRWNHSPRRVESAPSSSPQTVSEAARTSNRSEIRPPIHRDNNSLPAWTVKYGEEFWSRPARRVVPVSTAGGKNVAVSPGLDIEDIVERVSLALTSDDRGNLCAKTPTYVARFDAAGLVFSPGVPETAAGAAPVELKLRTTDVRLGDESLCRSGVFQWLAIGNTAQAQLDPLAGAIQHCEATRNGVEVAWVFHQRLPSNRPLTVEAELLGLEYAGETANGHHFADSSGNVRLRIGKAVVVDSASRKWDVAVHISGRRLSVTLPPDILAAATYPVCLDPAISPEYGMDNLLVYAPANSDQWFARAAWGGTNFLIVWEDDRAGNWSDHQYDIFGARVSAAGQLIDPAGIAICVKPMLQREPSVGWNGSTYYVTWQDSRNGTNYLVYGARVGADGLALDPDGVLIGTALTNRHQYSPCVAGRTGNVLVVWQDLRRGDSDVYGRLVDPSGLPIGSSDFPICNGTNNQHRPVAAWGLTNYLVAWTDYRHAGGAWNYTDIYGARVGADGAVMDTSSLAIGYFDSTYQQSPTVAWGGTNFLVVWEDSRNSTTSNKYDLFATRVSGSGQILDPSHFAVSSFASNQSEPCVAWGGTNFFVVWSDYRGGPTSDVYAARVSNAGRLLDSNGIPICTQANDQSDPSVAWNGSQFLVTWQTYSDAEEVSHIYASRVSETGAVLDAPLLVSKGGNNQWVPDAAWGATNYLVVWRDNLDETKSDIYGVRIGAAGGVLDPAGIAICAATNKQRDPAVAWGGTNFLVVWSDDRNLATTYADIYGARVSSAGQVLDTNGIAICTNPAPEGLPDVACDNNGLFLAVWQDYLTTNTAPIYYRDIGGARINSAGSVLDAGFSLILISTASNHQSAPVVAAGPTNFLVAWEDLRNGRNDSIYAARVDSSRNVLDTNGIAVGAGPTNAVDPAVAWGGTNFLVVWEDYRGSSQGWTDIYGSRVNPAGGILDGSGFVICSETNIQSDPTVGWSGTNFLVAWVNEDPEPNTLYGSRVDNAGHVLDGADPGFELFTNRMRRVEPALAPRSNGLFLAVFPRFRMEEYNSFRIIGAFVDISPPALHVITPYGGSYPEAGTHYAVRGLPVCSMITNAPVIAGDTQYSCRGWAGTGSAPSGLGTNTGSFVLDRDSVVTWLWTTNYRLAVAISGRGSADWTNGWIPYASNIVVTAANGAHFYFAGWQGDVPAADTNNNPVTLVMSRPRLAIPNFTPYLTSNNVPHWWLAEHRLATNDTATLQDQDGDGQKTWEEYIAYTDPTNRSSSFAMLAGGAADSSLTVTLSGTLTDRVYDVLFQTGLLNRAGAWTACGYHLPGTGSNLTIVLSNSAPYSTFRFSVKRP
jgi:hypothetical protein